MIVLAFAYLLACSDRPSAERPVDSTTSLREHAQAPPPTRPSADTSSVESHVTSRYTVVVTTDPDTGREAANRFLEAGPARTTDLWPRDSTCRVYLSYTDGLFCLTVDARVPFFIRPFSRPSDQNFKRAEHVAQLALGTRFDSVGRFLMFNEVDSLPSGACTSFDLRQLNKPSSEAEQRDVWADAVRAFWGFACEIHGRVLYPPNLVSTDSSAHQPLTYSEEGSAIVWDLFNFRRAQYLLVYYAACAGECSGFEILRLDPDKLSLAARIRLSSM
jgi:hypothetical protein